MAGVIFNNNKFKGVSINGQIVKGLAKNGIVFWKPESFHPLTMRILARAAAIGATPDTNLVNFDNFVRVLADNASYFDFYFNFRGTGDLNFRRINFLNPEGDLGDFVGGITFDTEGVQGNGVNAYFDPKFNASLLIAGQKYQLNDASKYYIIVSGSASATIEGVLGGTGQNYSYYGNATGSVTINTTSSLDSIYANNRIGLTIINRTSSTSVNIIKKDEQVSRVQNSAQLYNSNVVAFRRGSNFGNVKLQCYANGKSIPFAVSQILRAAENAYNAGLGISQIA